MSAIPQNTNLIIVDTRVISKTFILPSVQANPGRILVIKDYYGTATQSTITITTQGSDLIDDYNISYSFSNAYGTLTFISDGISSWRMMGLYNGALSFASATNPTYLVPSGGSVVLLYVNPNAATIVITATTYAARYNFYVTSSSSSFTVVVPIVSGSSTTAGTIVSSGSGGIVGATYLSLIHI